MLMVIDVCRTLPSLHLPSVVDFRNDMHMTHMDEEAILWLKVPGDATTPVTVIMRKRYYD